MAKKQESTSKTRAEKNSKTESRKKKTLNNDEALSTESQNDDVSSEEDGLGVNKGSSSSSKHTTEEKKKLGKKKRKTLKEEDEDEGECKFPMNRISRIVRSDFNSDLRIAQEAVFLINRASEKFLQLFCREAYACAFIDHKNYIAYNHLSSVVSKRKRFDFLSDFVPHKVQAEYALKQISGAEK